MRFISVVECDSESIFRLGDICENKKRNGRVNVNTFAIFASNTPALRSCNISLTNAFLSTYFWLTFLENYAPKERFISVSHTNTFSFQFEGTKSVCSVVHENRFQFHSNYRLNFNQKQHDNLFLLLINVLFGKQKELHVEKFQFSFLIVHLDSDVVSVLSPPVGEQHCSRTKPEDPCISCYRTCYTTSTSFQVAPAPLFLAASKQVLINSSIN